jgi:hypothetical protein
MKRAAAEKIVRTIWGACRELNPLLDLVHESSADQPCDEMERKFYRQHIGKVIAIMSIDVLGPILKEHPDLAPKELAHGHEDSGL